MKKTRIVLILLGVLIIFILYFSLTNYKWNLGEDDLRRYKGIAWAEIPGQCLEYRDDVCGLFSCMVEKCWCDDSSDKSPIIYEPKDVMVQNKEEAISLVEKFLEKSDFVDYKVTSAVQLNNIFFNVFIEDASHNEITFTVAADGLILKTICGV